VNARKGMRRLLLRSEAPVLRSLTGYFGGSKGEGGQLRRVAEATGVSRERAARPGPVVAVLAVLAVLSVPSTVGADEARPGAAPPPGPPEPQMTKAPELEKFIEADYPAAAKEKGLEGEVVMVLTVDEKGGVTVVEIQKKAGNGFDEAAGAAARRFRFKPAMAGDKPIPVQITYRYKFTLAVEKKAPKEAPAEGLVNLTGTIKERGTRVPLAGAEVSLLGRDDLVAITDDLGNFEFRGVPAGKHKLKFMLVEYEPAVVEVEVSGSERTDATVYLEKVSYTQYSTTVRGERVKQVVTRHVLEQEEIKKIPGTQGDTIKVVEVLPGVARTPFGLGGLLVFRGSNSQGSSVFADGGPIPMLFHFGALRSVINSDLIEDLEFYPGNAGIYYSDVTGGVIDVKTRAPKDDRLHGKLDVNIYEGGFLVEGPIVKDLSFAGAFHRNWHDVVLNAVWPSDSPAQMTVAPVYYDYQLKLRWKADAKNTVDTFFFGSDDRMVIVAGKSEQSGMEFGSKQYFHKLSVAHTWKPSEAITNTFTPTFMFLGVDMNVMTEYYIGDSEYIYGIRDDLNWRLSPAYQLNFGILAYGGHIDLKLHMPHLSAEGEEGHDSGGMPQGRGLNVVQDMAEAGGYAELVAEPVSRLKLIPGLRFDWYSYVYKYSVDPRLAIRFKAADWTTLKAGAGTYHKRPMGPYIIKKYGNPDLDLEMSAQYSLGVEQNLTELIRLDVTAFYIDMRDLVTTNPDLNTNLGAAPYVNGFTNLNGT